MSDGPALQDDRSDEALVAALNAGDTSAFDVLYYRYRDWVIRLALRFTANREDALDVLQEAFAYFFGKFPGFMLTARMTTFLYPVVRNLSIAARRKRRRHVSEQAVPDAPARAPVQMNRVREELSQALASLSGTHREVLLMRYVDDLNLSEIAEALGIPVGTVKSRLHHAIARLRTDERLKEYFGLT